MNFPVFRDGVFFKVIEEVLCIIQQSILDGKVINYKQEEGVFFVILPKSGRVFDRVVSVWCQVLDEILMCNDSGLLDSIHAFDDLNVYKSIFVNDDNKAVLIDDLLGDDKDVYLHILGVG